MGDVGSDVESAGVLVEEFAHRLYEKDPNHPLLKYHFSQPGDTPEMEKEIQEEMKNRFWDKSGSWKGKPGAVVAMVVMTNYYLALKRALEEIEAKDKPLEALVADTLPQQIDLF